MKIGAKRIKFETDQANLELFFFKIWSFETFEQLKSSKCIFVFLVCCWPYIDVLNVFMRFRVIFCIYEYI